MKNEERKTASPKTADKYEELVDTLDKVESATEYTGSAVTPLRGYNQTEFFEKQEKMRNESIKRQNK